MYNICLYSIEMQNKIISFLSKAFKEDNRILKLQEKDSDLTKIEEIYIKKGNFWCAVNSRDQIIGTIALRPLEDFFEIRRYFVSKKEKNKGIGKSLLATCIEYAIDNNIRLLKAATLERGTIAQHIFEKFGFKPTRRYANSSADRFYELELTDSYIYKFKLKKLRKKFHESLILNPTENIPMYLSDLQADFLEGLYVSERLKDVNDKVIFAGRNDYIKFFEYIKQVWKTKLNAFDVDLKTLSGLNAHLILFLCILRKDESVLLLPEICGGHFATSQILENLGAKVIHMIPDNQHMCVDVERTQRLIEQTNPTYIFVDRSEGLNYEDFSWLKQYTSPYKIYDASQYFSQILVGTYCSPFDMGFDMIVSTLHKNFPGPQKGIIATKQHSEIWQRYLSNAKTYISNTHPMAIAKSLMPFVEAGDFNKYTDLNAKCTMELERELIALGLPVVKRNPCVPSTLHIWLLCVSKEASHEYYLKLEQLNILTNYRLLPYQLGYGLRIGTSAAVRCGLRPKHINELANIMAEAYYCSITPQLKKRSAKLIATIFIEGLSDKL